MAKRKLGSYKCAHCDRVFTMPAHLVRHTNSAHAAGGVKPKRGRPLGSKNVSKLFQMPSIALPNAALLVNQMQSYRGELLSQRAAVDGQIEAIERAIAAFGAPAPRASAAAKGPRGRRGPREGSLKTYIEKVLQAAGKPLAVKDVADGVIRAGFQTKNKALAKSIGVALTQMAGVRKVDRGVFAMK
jgi:hypothetical protein